MNGDDRLGARGDGAFDQGGIHRVGLRIHIHKHRARTGVRDSLGGGHESGGDGDDLIASTHTQRKQGKPEGIGTIADADGVSTFTIGGEIPLERGNKRPAGERTRSQNLVEGSQQLLPERLMLCF